MGIGYEHREAELELAVQGERSAVGNEGSWGDYFTSIEK